jgi:hypothetical protein
MKRIYQCAVIAALIVSMPAWGQTADIPLRKVSLYSSGVGFFEHTGQVTGNATLSLPFNINALNDALKSLVINDSESVTPHVNYPSENTYWRTLQSLKIDISGNRGIVEILQTMKGAEVSISTPAQVLLSVPVTGRIVAVDIEERFTPRGEKTVEPAITLNTENGLRRVVVKDVQNITFKDKEIQADLNRALNLIASYRTGGARNLNISLPGKKQRDVSVSYVIPTPIWKVSYRLDLDARAPLLQGWAIIDNDGDTDWKNVELSLITGRQVSFIQNLYEPYYQSRPHVPLAIAGVAEARTYEDAIRLGGDGAVNQAMAAEPEHAAADSVRAKSMARAPAPAASAYMQRDMDGGAYGQAAARGRLTGAAVETAQGQAAGEQFEYRFPKPVSLPRQQSTMLPLVEAPVAVRKTLIFSGSRSENTTIHPQISAELTNNTGMKLPAGAITVFDSGSYAGDALLNFFPQDEKRYISFGDDLTVSGSSNTASTRLVQSVRISKGLLVFTRNVQYIRTYTIRNGSQEQKQIIIEHPIMFGAALREPEKADSETVSHYRFERTLPAQTSFIFAVKEDRPLEESAALARLPVETLLSYSTSAEMPKNVRDAFAAALELRRKADDARKSLAEFDDLYKRLSSEQERIRKNLEAAGRETPEGGAYLARLSALDKEIDACMTGTENARQISRTTQNDYETYIQSLEL